MWRLVDLVWTDVSEERIVSIFMVEKSASEEPEWAGGCSLQPEDGGDTFLCNVGSHMIYMTPHPRRRHSSNYLFVSIMNLCVQCFDVEIHEDYKTEKKNLCKIC
jgi:hypothetical protein